MSAPLNRKPVSEKAMYRIAILALKQLKRKYSFDAKVMVMGFLWEHNIESKRKYQEAAAAIAFFEQKLKGKQK